MPIMLLVKGKLYRDGVDISPSEAYELFLQDPDSFNTSPASPGHYLEAYREASKQATNILCITLSSKLSTGYEMACVAKEQAKSEIPDEDYVIPLGQADIKREGTDVTVVSSAYMVQRALAVADTLQERNISVEVIDPRTWVPLDKQAVINSVKKTNRIVIMEEEPITGGAAAELAAIIADEAFDYLDAPIKRVCAPDTPVPFSPVLEKRWMPDEDDLIAAIDSEM